MVDRMSLQGFHQGSQLGLLKEESCSLGHRARSRSWVLECVMTGTIITGCHGNFISKLSGYLLHLGGNFARQRRRHSGGIIGDEVCTVGLRAKEA
jgi:hypothetical protein